MDAWSRRQTYYGLTPTRLLIAEPFKIRSVELENLDEITLEEYSDRTGTIILGREPHGRDLINYGGAFRTGTNILSRELYGRDQNDDDGALLERISDAQRVYTEIRAQRKKLRK